MLDPKLIRENPDSVREMLENRHSSWPIEEAQALEGRRRELLNEVEALKALVVENRYGNDSEWIRDGRLVGLDARADRSDPGSRRSRAAIRPASPAGGRSAALFQDPGREPAGGRRSQGVRTGRRKLYPRCRLRLILVCGQVGLRHG